MRGYLWEAVACGVGMWLPGICVGPLGELSAARVRDAWQCYFFAVLPVRLKGCSARAASLLQCTQQWLAHGRPGCGCVVI